MSEPVLSEADIRAIWHDDPATMDRETLRQLAHYITRPPVSWDPDSFHRRVREEPEEVLAATEAVRSRLQAYAADLEQEALRLNPTLKPGLTMAEVRELTHQLWDEGQGEYLPFRLDLEHAGLREVIGHAVFRSRIVEVEGEGFYADRYLKRRKEDGSLCVEITDKNTPLNDYVGRVIKHCLVTCLSNDVEAAEEQTTISRHPESEADTRRDSPRGIRVVSLLDAMHMRGGAYSRLRLDPEVNPLREEDGNLSALSDTWVILLFQSLCADGIIPADGTPGRDFVLLNEAEHARDITPLLDALRADERAVLLEDYDSSGKLVQARFLLAEDAERIRQAITEEHSRTMGAKQHYFLDGEGNISHHGPVTADNANDYEYVDWCECERCLPRFHEEALEPYAEWLMRQDENSVALLESDGEGTCVALDAMQYFLRPELNQEVVHLVGAGRELASQQKWMAQLVGLLTEHYYRLSYTTPIDTSPKGIKNAVSLIGYELATSLIHELDNVRTEVEQDFAAARLKYGVGPSDQARFEAGRRRAADLAGGNFYPKGGPPARPTDENRRPASGGRQAGVLSRRTPQNARTGRKSRRVNGS